MRSIRLILLGCLVLAMLPWASPAAGGGCHAPDGIEPKGSNAKNVAISECAFQDTVVYVDRGDEVTWHNKDGAPHTVTGVFGSWGSYDHLWTGDAVTYSFEEDGVYPYFCELHPSMVGAVVVGDGKGDIASGAGAITPITGRDEPGSNDVAGRTTSAPTSQTSDNDGVIALLVAGAAIVLSFAVRHVVVRRRAAAAA